MVAKRLIKWVLWPLESFYPTAKIVHMWRLRYAYSRFRKGPVLVLQMGKVGSRAVEAALEERVSDRPVYHSHFLSRERTAQTEEMRKEFFRTEKHRWVTRQWVSQFLLRTFEAHRDNHTWKLITLTREPVGRNISAFFENLDVVPCETEGEYEISSHYYQIEPTIVSVNDTSKLVELFFTRARHDSPLRFFDREIKNIFGIDVFESAFPIEKGFKIYKADRVELLVLRLEDLAECAGTAFDQYLDIPEFQVASRNVGAQKVYAPLYKAFNKHVVVDSDYAKTLLDSDYMRTFYSTEEIKSASDKWLRQSDRASA